MRDKFHYYKFYDWLVENGKEELATFEEPEDESMFAADYIDCLELLIENGKINEDTTFDEIYRLIFENDNEFVREFANYCENEVVSGQ